MKGSVFGQYIRRERQAAGVSIRTLAKHLGVSHVYLGEVERGIRGPLKWQRWRQVVEAIPTCTCRELGRLARLYKPLPLNANDAPAGYHTLALLFSDKFNEGSLRPAQVKAMLEILA